jgi:hypothetical protein
MSTVLKKHTRRLYCKPGENVLIESTQVRWFPERSGGRLDLDSCRQKHSKLRQLKGDHQARVHSDQMVLMLVRREAGPC